MSSTANADACPTVSLYRLRAIFRFWKKPLAAKPSQSVSSASLNCEGIPPMTTKLPVHPPATFAAHDARIANNIVLAADFFGADEAHHTTTVTGPPPYAPYGLEVIETQASVREPPTLARMLFFYGFLFFPFWLIGISILFFPLLPTEDWESGKSKVEKAKLLHTHRETEKKWARRCLIATSSLIAAVLLLAIIIKYGIMAPV